MRRGRALAVVDRTNNVLEQFFGTAKQGLRRRVGRAHLGRDLEDQPAQVALTANLRQPDYVRVLCGTLEKLPQAFAQLDGQPCTGPLPLGAQEPGCRPAPTEPGVGQRHPTLTARNPARSTPKCAQHYGFLTEF